MWHNAGRAEHGEDWGFAPQPWWEGDVLHLQLDLGDGTTAGTLRARKKGGAWAVLGSNIPVGAFCWAASLWRRHGGDAVSIARGGAQLM